MTVSESYIEAATVACPRPSCRAARGKCCTEVRCRHNYRNCDYAVCAYRAELPEPHLERAVAARDLEVTLRNVAAAVAVPKTRPRPKSRKETSR